MATAVTTQDLGGSGALLTTPAGVMLMERDVRMLAQVVQASADAIFCQDLSGKVLTWNAAAERVYGYRADEMLGRNMDEVLPDGTREELLSAHRAALAGERVERFDSWQTRRDGSLFPVNVSASPLLDREGAVVAVATTVADVSERVELAAALAAARVDLERHNSALTRSNRDLEQFAYVASHDLSEPLRVMTGFVEQLEHRYDAVLDDRGRRYMRHIVDASIRMRALINDLLDYSRFLRRERESVLVDTRAVLRHVVSSLGAQIEETGAHVDIGIVPDIYIDAQQLESLLQNLLSNSLKFRRPELAPSIEVSGERSGDWVVLHVDDNGLGIPAEYRERVFRMFQRLHAREAYTGTGIGLAIAQQIVELHGGRIWIDDSPLGGARIVLTLPAVAQAEPHHA